MRLELLPFIAVLGVIPGQALPQNPRSKCRCLFGDSSCWPSDAEFASLSSQLSQPLIYPVPPQSVCYSSSTSAQSECAKVIEHTADGNWRADQPGSMQAPNSEWFTFPNGSISACYANSKLGIPCEQGNIPPVGVDARTAGDVKAALMFADRWNLKVVIKNTGHDYVGRSAARGAFMIWTHNMKDITYDPTFVPQNAPSNESYQAITLGAGVQWHEAYRAVNEHQRLLVGGISTGGSVGAAGGWILGGGHSAFSPKHGLGVDNVLQFTLVTSSGSHLTVNSYTHPDLFWALRGGGGGTYGVVTSATYKTYPDAPLVGIYINVNFPSSSLSPSLSQSVITEFLGYFPKFADLGWGGYSYFEKNRLWFYGVAPDSSWTEVNKTVEPLFEAIRDKMSSFDVLSGGTNVGEVEMYTAPYDGVYNWFQTCTLFRGEDVGYNLELTSRLIPSETFVTEEKRAKFVERLLRADVRIDTFLVAGGQVSQVDPNAMGLHPAWRDALANVFIVQRWKTERDCQSGTDQAQTPLLSLDKNNRICGITGQDEAQLIDYIHALEEVAGPDAGSYFNEASWHEQNFQKLFFGRHYPELEMIKDKYDPSGLFVIRDGVGSERWDKELRCMK